MSKLLGLIALVLLAQVHAYDIILSCGTLGCTPGCSQCNRWQGGPFDDSLCIDPLTCDTIPQVITFTCGGCSKGVDCSYSDYAGSQGVSGCTNYADFYWPTLKQYLDQVYQFFNQKATTPYDWCANACSSGLSTGAIIGIAAGGVILLVIGIVVAIKICKPKKLETYQKM